MTVPMWSLAAVAWVLAWGVVLLVRTESWALTASYVLTWIGYLLGIIHAWVILVASVLLVVVRLVAYLIESGDAS